MGLGMYTLLTQSFGIVFKFFANSLCLLAEFTVALSHRKRRMCQLDLPSARKPHGSVLSVFEPAKESAAVFAGDDVAM